MKSATKVEWTRIPAQLEQRPAHKRAQDTAKSGEDLNQAHHKAEVVRKCETHNGQRRQCRRSISDPFQNSNRNAQISFQVQSIFKTELEVVSRSVKQFIARPVVAT